MFGFGQKNILFDKLEIGEEIMYTKHELVITAGDEFSAVEIQFSNEDDRGFALLANDLSRPPVKCLLTLKQLYALNRNIEKAIWYANSIGYKED